jgi:hypothetical protein
MADFYKLDKDHNVIPADDVFDWSDFFRDPDRIVKQEHVAGPDRRVSWVSTVFLGLDHGFDEERPLVFETMIKGPTGEWGYQARCSTWDEALKMHAKAVAMVTSGS